MTDKIILELTIDELKTLDKHIEYNEETKSVFDKIKYAYPQPKMTLQHEGEYVVVSYNDMTYYRLENSTCFCWYKGRGVSADHPIPTLVTLVTDAETERLLEGLYYNHIVVKKQKEPEDNEWKSVALRFGEELVSILPCGYYEFSAEEWFEWVVNTYEKLCDDTVKLLKKENLKKAQERGERVHNEMEELVRESVKWCEENQDKDPLDWLTPKTPEETEESLKEAFREAVKQGVVSSTKSKTLTDLIYRWWSDVFTTHSDWDMETSIEDLVDRIELFLPKEQSAEGSQNAYVESAVEGFNDCLTQIKGKLR
jgi:hypothetical protein